MKKIHSQVIGLALILSLLSCQKETSAKKDSSPEPAPESEITKAVKQLEAEAFTDEKEARHFENKGIVPHWDRFLAAPISERLKVFTSFPFDTLTMGTASAPENLDLGITEVTLTKGGETLDHKQWQTLLNEYQTKGYTLDHSDWHHAAFNRDENGTAISEVTFTLQGRRGEGSDTYRMQIKGTLQIIWNETKTGITPQSVSLLNGSVFTRAGAPAFVIRETIEGQILEANGRNDIGTINVTDLNGDSLPDIILGKENKILWNKGNFRFETTPLIPEGGQIFYSNVGLVADLNGDSLPDWIGSVVTGDLGIWFGKLGGGFSLPPYKIDLGEYKLRSPSSITAGDIDRDGDLDLYIGQWRPIFGEAPPENLWDANDGYGNTLLINNGLGKFADVTEQAGLQEKRFRRMYSASFLDLDDDRDLDLLVVSDFHGIDVFLNNGRGRFVEATKKAVDNPYSFGMSHTVADYDLDGKLDFFVMGMGSTTARRLDRMGAKPKDFQKTTEMRSVMGFGNRMYLQKSPGRFQQPKFLNQVARTGWSWGSTSFDMDNDGDQDIYAANGHISGQTSRDYCTNFWCRDIYLLDKFESSVAYDYFNAISQIKEQSWDGYQVNPLLINQAGAGFKDLSYLLDTGIDQDCRHIVSADLDLDGRVDLLVGQVGGTSGVLHTEDSKQAPPALLILQNVLAEAAERNWIGVSLQGGSGVSPLGAIITLHTTKGTQRATILSGDSFKSQHPAQKHFGLDDADVEQITIDWPNGKTTTLKTPKVGAYHTIQAP